MQPHNNLPGIHLDNIILWSHLLVQRNASDQNLLLQTDNKEQVKQLKLLS